MKTKLRSTAAAIMLLAPLGAAFVAQPAAAQQRAVAPVVTSMALNADHGISPGSTLRFQVYGQANAKRADVVLGESGITVPLRQQTKGNYTGSYVVRRTDRIDPQQLMTVRLTHGERTIARQFSYPPAFQALAMGNAPAATAPRIERFVMRPGGRLEAGREITFRVVGAPGARATMDIPGVVDNLALAEVRPGVYEGNYTVRQRDNLQAFDDAVATLRNGGQRVTAKVDLNERQERQLARNDRQAPQITDLTPAHGDRVGERGRTHISAKLSDAGSGIDRDSVRLRLAGRDVTGDARVSDDEINYRGDLEPGRYTADLTVRDHAGNMTNKQWTFDIVERDRERVGTLPPGVLPLQVTSHANNAVVDANGAVTIQGRTAPNATVRVQVDNVMQIPGMVGVAQPVADQTIQADRNGQFSVSVAPSGGLVIPGGRYDVRVTATAGSQTAQERITLLRRG